MVDEKKSVDSLLSSLEEIKKQTAVPPSAPNPAPDPVPVGGKDAKPGGEKPAGSDLLGTLLSEVKREAEEEKARLDKTLSSRDEEKKRSKLEEEEAKRAKYQKLVQEESDRRKGQLRQKEDRAKQAILKKERRKQAEVDKIAQAKAMALLKKKRKRQRVISLAMAAVVFVAASVAMSIFRPWERTEPLKGMEEVKSEQYLARKAEFKPLYNAGDRGDASYVEPRIDASLLSDSIPPIEALGWLLQGEVRSVRPDRRLHSADRVLLADTEAFRGQIEKRFTKMKWLDNGKYRPRNGGSITKPDPGLQLDLSAFGKKDKKKKKKKNR